jgi:integrase
MVSHRLAAKDDVHYAKNSRQLRQLLQEHMAKVNREVEEIEGPDILVSDFYGDTYLPWVEANKKPSTTSSYKQIWSQHLESHFEGAKLGEYRTSDASKFLTALAKRGYGRNTISHTRSSMSGLFSHAVNLGLIERNPLSEAKSLSTAKPPAETESYSLREVEDLISCLAERPDCQLVIALCGFLGLRPSECAAVQWGDVDLDQGLLHLRRGMVRGVSRSPRSASGCSRTRQGTRPTSRRWCAVPSSPRSRSGTQNETRRSSGGLSTLFAGRPPAFCGL